MLKNQYNYSALSYESNINSNFFIVSYLKYNPKDVNIISNITCNIIITKIVNCYFIIISNILLTNDGIAYPIYSSSESDYDTSSSLSTHLFVIYIYASYGSTINQYT